MIITNRGDISLPLAVWLLHSDYDFIDEPNYISVTRLMKPLRHIILPARVPPEQREMDVEDFIAIAMGNSIHASIERAWLDDAKRSLALERLGYPKEVHERVRINPTPKEASQLGIIAVYMEQRSIKEINGYKLGGKFDFASEGILQDFKSTSAYTWMYGGRDEEHQLQGSLYRWLNQDKITEDFIRINYVFTDWQKATAMQNPKYPQKRVMHKDIPLLTIQETERWIINKLNLVNKYWDAPEKDIPECTDEELWRSDPKYKYYADPTKTSGRSTKNFETLHDANKHLAGAGKGVVITVPGEVKRCGYCEAFPICSQKDRYQND